MKAAVMRVNNEPLSIEDLVIDEPGPGEVLIKTAASGICHSDLHMIEGGIPLPPPAVLGHEPAGVVEAVGEGVSEFAPGDHVIGCLNRWCGVCHFCTGGRPYLCISAYMPSRPPGAKPRLATQKGDPVAQLGDLSSFAEKMLCTERSLVKIREDMPLDRACLIGCGVTTGLGAALKTVHIPAGSSVVIIGCGGVGLAALQGARIGGAGKIIAVDTQVWKFDLAKNLGATHCVDATDGDPVAAVQGLTGGGADFVFECIGLVPTVEQAVSMTGRGGTTVLRIEEHGGTRCVTVLDHEFGAEQHQRLLGPLAVIEGARVAADELRLPLAAGSKLASAALPSWLFRASESPCLYRPGRPQSPLERVCEAIELRLADGDRAFA